jgi:dihydroorotate dehydrogenase electron transfer subunit
MIDGERKRIKLSIGTIEDSIKLTEDTFNLVVSLHGVSEDVSPGQFFMVKGWEGSSPLLRRPFSVSDIIGNCLHFIIKSMGTGTQLITELVKGDRLSLLGPLGRGFVLDREVKRHIMVAGGVGIAPFPLLVKALKKYDRSAEVELLYGDRDIGRLIDTDRLSLTNIPVSLATEDGSAGRRGLVTDLLSRTLSKEKSEETSIYACGPGAMLKEVQSQLLDCNVPFQFSLESYMGCGLGSCLGCVICTRKDGKLSYNRVCREGPVFDGKEVVF